MYLDSTKRNSLILTIAVIFPKNLLLFSIHILSQCQITKKANECYTADGLILVLRIIKFKQILSSEIAMGLGHQENDIRRKKQCPLLSFRFR